METDPPDDYPLLTELLSGKRWFLPTNEEDEDIVDALVARVQREKYRQLEFDFMKSIDSKPNSDTPPRKDHK